jgi:hypothetical protein
MPVVTRMSARSTLRAAFGCALGVAVIFAWTPPARAGDDDVAPDVKFLRGLLEGIGLKSGREKEIDYRERSPLVIPPSNTLLPPETDAATKNPNWPVDPEVKLQKQLRAAERNQAAGSSSDEFVNDAKPVSVYDMTKGPKGSSPRNAGAMSPEDSARPFSPSQLGTKPGGLLSGLFAKSPDDEKPARFTGEPPRASLTDPPAGYQTPSPNEVYGKAKEVYKPKATNYYETHGVTDGVH